MSYYLANYIVFTLITYLDQHSPTFPGWWPGVCVGRVGERGLFCVMGRHTCVPSFICVSDGCECWCSLKGGSEHQRPSVVQVGLHAWPSCKLATAHRLGT